MSKLIVFHASWCGPCRAYDKILSEMKVDYPEVTYEDYDVDSSDPRVAELMRLYGVRSVPTSIIQPTNGEELKKFGLITKSELITLLNL